MSLHFSFILLINQCISYAVCLLSVVISETDTGIQGNFSTGDDKWENQIRPLATFCCAKIKPQKRLFQNTEMHEVKTWQDTAWQESFQLTGSGQQWKISPGAFHTQEKVG